MQFAEIWSHLDSTIKFGCILIIVVAFVLGLWMFRTAFRVNRQLNKLRDFIGDVKSSSNRSGLDLEHIDALRSKAKKSRDLSSSWWGQIEEHIEPYLGNEEKEEYFLTETVRDILPFERVVNENYFGSFFGVIPGILTGVGLTLTFIAILLALDGVHYDRSNAVNPITGIDSLINGLSGKFVSSIFALILSIVFTLIERGCARSLRRNYDETMRKVANAIPSLSSSRILLDMHRLSSKQTLSLSNLSSELVDRLTNTLNSDVIPGLASTMSNGFALSLQAEFQPTMERMAGSLDRLQDAIVKIESQKQESVTDEISRMSESLERSITKALEGMGTKFHEALTGTAKNEFGNAQTSMENTRLLLQETGRQFSEAMNVFKSIALKAEQTTDQQLTSGKEQTVALNEVMHGLMIKLKEASDQNMSSMQTQLTLVVRDLTGKVSDLSEELLQASKTIVDRADQNVNSIIARTDEASKVANARMEALLANIEARSSDFNEASRALLEAKQFVTNLLLQNGDALTQMSEASSLVKAYSMGLAGHTEDLKNVQGSHLSIAMNLREVANTLKGASDRHEEQLSEYRDAVNDFQRVFGSLDESIARIMTSTNSGLTAYNQSIEKNFNSIVDIANDLVPKVTNLLTTQIDELQEQLEELGTVIEKSVEVIRGRKP